MLFNKVKVMKFAETSANNAILQSEMFLSAQRGFLSLLLN